MLDFSATTSQVPSMHLLGQAAFGTRYLCGCGLSIYVSRYFSIEHKAHRAERRSSQLDDTFLVSASERLLLNGTYCAILASASAMVASLSASLLLISFCAASNVLDGLDYRVTCKAKADERDEIGVRRGHDPDRSDAWVWSTKRYSNYPRCRVLSWQTPLGCALSVKSGTASRTQVAMSICLNERCANFCGPKRPRMACATGDALTLYAQVVFAHHF